MAASVANLFSLTLLITAFGHARYNESWTDDRETVPRNCLDIQRQESNKSGIYKVYPFHNNYQHHIQVYCDMKTSGGGWTVIQCRYDIDPRDNFYCSWSDYVSGFGDLLSEFWLGLDYIHTLMYPMHMNMRFDLTDFEGNFHDAEYSSFRVNSNYSYYRMTVSGFTGEFRVLTLVPGAEFLQVVVAEGSASISLIPTDVQYTESGFVIDEGELVLDIAEGVVKIIKVEPS